ncbi:MAG: MEDS domain-containing protein [Candidatus Geothermincolia bacterium]
MTVSLRDSGIDIIGDVPWGTHFCHFYDTREDILDILVPYFKAGLAANEFCMWVTCDPLTVQDAREALSREVPGLDSCFEQGRMEIVPYDQWYVIDGVFDMDRVFGGWIAKLEKALANGLDGMRATGNTAWLEKDDWQDFTEYEEELERIIGGYRMMAICTYSLQKCSASEVLDVVRNHEYALTKQGGRWQLIESSERKRVAEALRASESRYKRIVETASEGVWTIDSEGRTTFVNDSLLEMLGYAREEMLGRSVFEFCDIEYAGDLRLSLERVNGGENDVLDGVLRRQDGTSLHALVSAAPILDAEGMYEGALGMITDITERKLAEDMLLKVNMELDGYARTLAHDLRNPLSSIALANSLTADALEEEDSEHMLEEVRESCRSIEKNVNRSFRLTTNLLALAQAGQQPRSVEDIDISEVVATILEERAADPQLMEVEMAVSDDLGIVRADQTHMYQLFSNLISNAVKHNDAAEPKVEVRLVGDNSDGTHGFMVRDNGSGIPEADIESVFLPFFKKGERADTGIGLAIVEKIVRLYGGEIEVSNDGGACFRFVLHDKQL